MIVKEMEEPEEEEEVEEDLVVEAVMDIILMVEVIPHLCLVLEVVEDMVVMVEMLIQIGLILVVEGAEDMAKEQMVVADHVEEMEDILLGVEMVMEIQEVELLLVVEELMVLEEMVIGMGLEKMEEWVEVAEEEMMEVVEVEMEFALFNTMLKGANYEDEP